jgi:broad specificity phosphatase PhoE
MIGWTDLPADLTDLAAINRLRAHLPAQAITISSDLIRASATADAICPGPRLPHDPALREIHFGAWEQRTFADIEAESAAHIRAFWDEPGQVRSPGGEGWDDLTHRVWAATDRLAHAHPDADIVIVAHFGAILAALQRALNIAAIQAFAHKIDNLSVTELMLTPHGWQVGHINHRP